MSRRGFGWLAVILGAGAAAALVWPMMSGQEALWMVTVGSEDPRLTVVGERVLPLKLILEGSDAVPPALRARLILAVALGLGCAAAGLMWWRRPTDQ